MFFRANVSQVKLHNISLLFNMTLHEVSDNEILPLYLQNSKRNEKVNTRTSEAATQKFSAK